MNHEDHGRRNRGHRGHVPPPPPIILPSKIFNCQYALYLRKRAHKMCIFIKKKNSNSLRSPIKINNNLEIQTLKLFHKSNVNTPCFRPKHTEGKQPCIPQPPSPPPPPPLVDWHTCYNFAMRLSNKLLWQGDIKERLKSSLRKFNGQYEDLIKQYEV